MIILTACTAACTIKAPPERPRLSAEAGRAARLGFSEIAQQALERGMAPGAAALARTLAIADAADDPAGWAVLDLARSPDLALGPLSFEQAQRLNAFLPAAGDGQAQAQPFVLAGAPAERSRALLCLSQAVYYEAALEPTPGQEAVAQTVLNRLRHPAFPKSVCGVVYQGAAQVTGCQFSFTCDGSRARPPIEPFWSRSRAVAARALAGYVMAPVGEATHYHADYVFPRWGPTLVKIRQFGAQIFYRFPGPPGQPVSFREPYRGGELRVSMLGPSPEAILASRAAGAPPAAPGTETYTVTDPKTGAVTTRVAGQLRFGRRDPTPEEVSRINTVLAAMADAAHAAPGAPKP